MLETVKAKVLSKILKRSNKVIPKSKEVYAVVTGAYVGEMLVYCTKDQENYFFLSIPKNINRVIPIDKFKFAIDNKIAEFVDVLPKKVYNICLKQFEYNKSKLDSKATVLK